MNLIDRNREYYVFPTQTNDECIAYRVDAHTADEAERKIAGVFEDERSEWVARHIDMQQAQDFLHNPKAVIIEFGVEL
jgi:hypothetical protein